MWRERLNTSEIQLCLKWCGSGVNRLFSAGMDYSQIHVYDVTVPAEIKRNKADDGSDKLN